MSRLIRHQVDLNIPEIMIPGMNLNSIHCQIQLQDFSTVAEFPFQNPIVLEIQDLSLEDKLSIGFINNSEEVASLQLEMNEMFSQDLEGSFDKWFKLDITGGSSSSPGKNKSQSSSFMALYEAEEPVKQFGRARIAMSCQKLEQTQNHELDSESRLNQLKSICPAGLGECARCGYLEKLTITQQNDLLRNEELSETYREVKALIRQQEEEELRLPAQFRMEYSHRRDEFMSSIDPNSEPSVAIDLPTKFTSETGGLSPQDAEHLRMVILGLNEKLKGMHMLQREVKSLRAELGKCSYSRKELQVSIEETTEQLHKQNEKQQVVQQQLLTERNNTVEQLREQHVAYKEKCSDEERALAQVQKLEAENAMLRAEAMTVNDLKLQVESLTKCLKDSEENRRDLQKKFQECMDNFQKRTDEQQNTAKEQIQIMEQQQQEIERLQEALQQQNQNNEDHIRENGQLNGEITRLEGEVAILSDKQKQKDDVYLLLREHEAGRHELQLSLTDAVHDFHAKLQEMGDLNNKLLDEKQQINSSLTIVENEVEMKNEQIQDLNKEKFELNGNIATLEQLLWVREDMQQLVEDLQNQNEMYRSIKEQLLKELNFLTDYLLTQTEKTLSGHRIVNKLKSVIDDKKIEIECLRRIVTELQSRSAVYIPVKEDPVDYALSEFINVRDKPLEVPFCREQPGVYLFGTKRVFVKYENGKIIIRVGGGFMQLDEFIELYTPLELEKWEMKQMENNMRNQALGTISKGRAEKSPQRNLSPARANQILNRAINDSGSKFNTFYAVPKRGFASPLRNRSRSPGRR